MRMLLLLLYSGVILSFNSAFCYDFLSFSCSLFDFSGSFFDFSGSFFNLQLKFLQLFLCFLQFIELKQEHLFLLFFFLMYFLFFLFDSLKLFIQKLHLIFQIFIILFWCRYLDFRLFLRYFNFFRFRWSNDIKFWFIEFSPLELSLTHKTLGFDPLSIVVRAFACILEIHESFE